MIKEKNISKRNFPILIICLLFLIIIVQLIYYLKPEKTTNMRNILQLSGWTSQVKFLENIKFQNGILSLDNTFGHVKDGFFNYINRIDPVSYKKGMNIDLQLKKTKGDKISVNFATSISENRNDWWTMKRGVEVQVMDNGNIYLNHFVEDRKNKDELYYVGILPDDGFITLDFAEAGIVSIKNKKGDELGAVMFDKDPFEGVSSFYLGLRAGPNSILEVSHFRILTPNE